ncbi:MAG: metal ABC transporter permease, partial [Gammaproteobacteria bacterium]
MNDLILDPGLLLPAWLAGLLVLSSHVPLGQQVLARGIIFMDLAIAQIAALGVVVAHATGLDGNAWGVQAAALTAALGGAALLHFT